MSTPATEAQPSAHKDVLCSEFGTEPLYGTAKAMKIFVAVEYLHGWGHDIMDEDVLGEYAKPLKSHLKKHKAGMQFIRKPGRAGQFRTTRKLYISDTTEGTCYSLAINGPEDLLQLDLTALSQGQWGTSQPLGNTPENGTLTSVDHPIMLVCTHGKRDRCCALKGRPLAAAMQTCFYGDEVWETSHAKGHRFAPTMVLLPWGYSYGRLNPNQAIEAVKEGQKGHIYLPGLRGRGCWDESGQVAEIAAIRHILANEPHHHDQAQAVATATVTNSTEEEKATHPNPEPEDCKTVSFPDGSSWLVQLKRKDLGLVMASCGTEPKPATGWEPIAVHKL